jgi:hypothetical protein
MKFAIFGLLAVLAAALQEPLPINPEEEQDEVAQAQQRAVWIACLDLASTQVESNLALISRKAVENSISIEKIIKKYSAGLLLSCSKTVEVSLAEKYLSGEESDDVKELKNRKFGESFSELRLFELNLEERNLIDRVFNEANRKNDGFDQEAPVLQEVLNLKDNRIVYAAVGGVAVVVFGILLATGGSKAQEGKGRDKSPGKKKRE